MGHLLYQESLRKEAEESGFKVCGIFGDIAGMPLP